MTNLISKKLCARDLSASNHDDACAILGQMETVLSYEVEDGIYTVEYNTDSQEAIEKDWLEACASLEPEAAPNVPKVPSMPSDDEIAEYYARR